MSLQRCGEELVASLDLLFEDHRSRHLSRSTHVSFFFFAESLMSCWSAYPAVESSLLCIFLVGRFELRRTVIQSPKLLCMIQMFYLSESMFSVDFLQGSKCCLVLRVLSNSLFIRSSQATEFKLPATGLDSDLSSNQSLHPAIHLDRLAHRSFHHQ